MAENLQDRERARKEIQLRTFTWNFTAELEGMAAKKKGAKLMSPTFSKMKVPDMKLEFYPYGHEKSPDDKSALYLLAPAGWSITYRLRAAGEQAEAEREFDGNSWGWNSKFPLVTSFSEQEVSVELLKAVPSPSS